MSEAIHTPLFHIHTTPRQIYDATSGEVLVATPDEAGVVVEGALPPSCPDSLEARREMGRTIKVTASTSDQAARFISAWWGGVKRKGEEPLALYARVLGVWHAVRIGLGDFDRAPKRTNFRIDEEMLLKAIEAEGSRSAVRRKLEAYLSLLVPEQRTTHPVPTAPKPPSLPQASPPAAAAVSSAKASGDAVELPPHASVWSGPTHKGAAPLTVEVLETQLPEEIADLIDTMNLPQGTFYAAKNESSITLYLPPAALNGDPTKRLTSTVEVRRAKLPQKTAPWICTLSAAGEEVTSKIQKTPRDAIDNALLLSSKTPLAPYKKALSVFLGGPN